jgi:hypothetical protein
MEELDKTIYNEFEQSLIDAGYHFFTDNWKHSIRGIQKRFEDKKGTKYFITVYHYNFAKQFPGREDLVEQNIDRYTFTCQFRKDEHDENGENGKDQTVDVSYSADFVSNPWRPLTTLQEAEEFFEKMFVTFEFEYYELKDY